MIPFIAKTLILFTFTSYLLSNVSASCVDVSRYYQIYDDILSLATSIDNDIDRSHFYGGIVRLVAHDFMDYDQSSSDPMGMDGCIDWIHGANAGLSSIWNEHTDLYKLHETKYSDISRPDFWIIAANAVIYHTSIDNSLDLINTFYWGRKERNECLDSAQRLPHASSQEVRSSCQQVEDVFLTRMGLTWKDAVALMGAHTLGRGHAQFSGHHGTWASDDRQAQIFDKQYYQELLGRAWSPRQVSVSPPIQDWSSTQINSGSPKMMLNTDMCLVYNLEKTKFPCCTRTDLRGRCMTLGNVQCERYDRDDDYYKATEAVLKYMQGTEGNFHDNTNFYEAFRLAWYKATINSVDDLQYMVASCS